jgi:protein-tyrosine phosphatase
MPGTAPIRLCFVCLGNICRSPTAAAVMAHKVRQAGLEDVIQVESAGTSGWHIGEPPDRRAVAEARRRGIPMTNAGKRFTRADFARYDLVLAMDAQNADDLRAIAPDAAARAKIRLLRSFAPGIDPTGDMAVPDPYFGGDDGFTTVFDMIDAACAGLLEHLRTTAPPAR